MVRSGHADVADLKNMIGDLTKAMVRKVTLPPLYIHHIYHHPHSTIITNYRYTIMIQYNGRVQVGWMPMLQRKSYSPCRWK